MVGLRFTRATTYVTTIAAAPPMANARMLLSMNGVASATTTSIDEHESVGGDVGTKATIAASTPARLSRTSSQSVLPLMAIRLTPMTMSAATNTACTGV